MVLTRLMILAGLLSLAACSAPPMLSVDKAYVRLAAVPNRPAVAYFVLHGGTSDATLIDVSCDVSVRSEMHESMEVGGSGGGMAMMKPLRDVAIHAGSSVVFAPGGKHVMLFDMNPGVKPGRRVMLTFTFSNNQRIEFNAPTIAAGAPVPTE